MNEPSPAGSTRTCVGCGQRAERGSLLGLFFAPPAPQEGGGIEGKVGVASGGESFTVSLPGAGRPVGASGGRGVHVHGRSSCLEGAARKGLNRALRRPVRVTVAELRAGVGRELGRHVGQTLRAARRQRVLGLIENHTESQGDGRDQDVTTTDAPLLLVHAIDTRAAGGREASAGQVQAGTRRQLGVLMGRPEVPVIALHHRQLASRLQQACALASAVAIGGLEVG